MENKKKNRFVHAYFVMAGIEIVFYHDIYLIKKKI